MRQILNAVSGKSPETTGRDKLTVAVTDDSALSATIQRLTTAGISVTELSLHLPSLDEVFFTLTGQRGSTPEEAVA